MCGMRARVFQACLRDGGVHALREGLVYGACR